MTNKEYLIHRPELYKFGKFGAEEHMTRLNCQTFKKNPDHESVLAIIFHRDKKIIVNAFTIRGLNRFREAKQLDKWKYLPEKVTKKLLSESKKRYELYASEENMQFWEEINNWNDYLISKI